MEVSRAPWLQDGLGRLSLCPPPFPSPAVDRAALARAGPEVVGSWLQSFQMPAEE